jgi:hypothetical protein
MTKYKEEIQAWKDFELDSLIEEQEKPVQIVSISDMTEDEYFEMYWSYNDD